MAAKNLLVILSNAHQPRALSCAGHPIARTPNLDALARNGTRFNAAYAPAPISAPARAGLATGCTPAAMGRHFDAADPYDGALPSWHHAVRAAGHAVVAIGGLHFRLPPGDDHGFSEEILATCGADGGADASAPGRDEAALRPQAGAGPGESGRTRCDRDIASAAQVWLREEAPRQTKPWCLFVSLATPDFPLIAPPEHYYATEPARLALPKLHAPDERPRHPFLEERARALPLAAPADEAAVRRMLAGYYGLVAFVDEQVGRVLECLLQTGLTLSTRVLYASGHGDNAGARGLWGAATMYEESVGVPMILAGHAVPPRTVVATPVSLLDVFPTVLDTLGIDAPAPAGTASLVAIAHGSRPKREVIAEYHAPGPRGAAFMLRDERWKYVRYVDCPPQLFDLDSDPEELADLGESAAHAALRARLEARLVAGLGAEPEGIEARAQARHAEVLAAQGGRAAVAVAARADQPGLPPPATRTASC